MFPPPQFDVVSIVNDCVLEKQSFHMLFSLSDSSHLALCTFCFYKSDKITFEAFNYILGFKKRQRPVEWKRQFSVRINYNLEVDQDLIYIKIINREGKLSCDQKYCTR